MKALRICANCCKTLRFDADIGLAIYRAGKFSRDFLYVLDLIVPESNVVFPLFSRVYHVSFREEMLNAGVQGRKDDMDEAAFLEFVERWHKTQSMSQEG